MSQKIDYLVEPAGECVLYKTHYCFAISYKSQCPPAHHGCIHSQFKPVWKRMQNKFKRGINVIDQLVEIAKNAIDEEAEILKQEILKQRDLRYALEQLENKAAELKRQVETLANLPVSKDLLDFYIRLGGNVWVSKIVGLNQTDIHLMANNYSLTFPDRPFSNLQGAYRLIIMAIATEIPPKSKMAESQWKDDFGRVNPTPTGKL